MIKSLTKGLDNNTVSKQKAIQQLRTVLNVLM